MYIKTANGKQKIVMSRSEWEAIGKRAGWGRSTEEEEPVPEDDWEPDPADVALPKKWTRKPVKSKPGVSQIRLKEPYRFMYNYHIARPDIPEGSRRGSHHIVDNMNGPCLCGNDTEGYSGCGANRSLGEDRVCKECLKRYRALKGQ